MLAHSHSHSHLHSKCPNFSKTETEDLIFVLKANFLNVSENENNTINPHFHLMLKEYLIRNLPQNEEVKKIIERLEQLTN